MQSLGARVDPCAPPLAYAPYCWSVNTVNMNCQWQQDLALSAAAVLNSLLAYWGHFEHFILISHICTETEN